MPLTQDEDKEQHESDQVESQGQTNAITPPRPKACERAGGGRASRPTEVDRGKTPLKTSTPAAKRETAEDVRDAVHGVGHRYSVQETPRSCCAPNVASFPSSTP